MRFRPRPAVVRLVLMLGAIGSRARADGALAIDEAKSGLHLDVEGACQVRPADGGGAACESFAASAHKSDVFAVVLGPNGLLSYSVAIFADREPGSGEERAFGGQRFLRARLEMANGAALCFITADQRAEVAVIMFAADREALATVELKAEAAMRTVRRASRESTSSPGTAPPPPMSRPAQLLITAFLGLLFGLPVLRFITRAVKNGRRNAKSKR
jgi:hypothetical protein